MSQRKKIKWEESKQNNTHFAQKNLLCKKEDTCKRGWNQRHGQVGLVSQWRLSGRGAILEVKNHVPSEKRCSCYSRVKRKFLLFAQCWEHLNYFLFFVSIIKAGLGWPSSNYCSHCSGFTQLEQCLQGLQSRAVLRTGWVGWEQRHRVCSPRTAEPSVHRHQRRAPLPAPLKSQTIHLTLSSTPWYFL